ncbi:MAG TPA: hypothetical protein VF017_06745 [Thermoanaerobaculia bacterium]|nr:hypothetical protein [Thermoanaerobaculia bacterium]
MNSRKQRPEHTAPRGRLTLTVSDPGGRTVAERRVGNIVLRQGAAIIAGLFAGQNGAAPINRIQVGFGTEGGDPSLASLTPPDPPIDPVHLSTPLGPEAFGVVTDGARAVQVSIQAVFKPTENLKDVTEAGLLAGDQLYNQVVFEPVELRIGQDVTFFWEVDFPFGH